jgi:hypothetical protein
VRNRGAAEQRALLERVKAAGIEVEINEAPAIEPDHLLVEQTGPDAVLFDLEPFGTGLIVPIGITCRAANFFTADCEVTLPFRHPPLELLEPNDMADKFREYAFFGKHSVARPYCEVINHRLGQMRRGDRIEGALLAMTHMPMPAHWFAGRILATLAVLNREGYACSTELDLFVREPKTRDGSLAAMAAKSGLCRPVRAGVGRSVALANSFDGGAPEGSQGRRGHPSAFGGGKKEGS